MSDTRNDNSLADAYIESTGLAGAIVIHQPSQAKGAARDDR